MKSGFMSPLCNYLCSTTVIAPSRDTVPMIDKHAGLVQHVSAPNVPFELPESALHVRQSHPVNVTPCCVWDAVSDSLQGARLSGLSLHGNDAL